MDNLKGNNYYLNKILENLYDIKNFIKDVSFEQFVNDELLQSGICFKYVQAYENAKNLNQNDFSDDFKLTLIKLRGFRNLIVHEYGKIDFVSVYDTSIKDVPNFIDEIEKHLI